MPSQLWFRLLIGTCLALGITLAAVLLLVNKAVTGSFQDYVEDQQSVSLQRAESILSRYYDRRREWAGVETTVQSVADLMGARLVLADAQGRVVADSASVFVGQTARESWRGKRISIRSQEFAVGTLYINPMRAGERSLDPRADVFLSTLNSYLAWAVAVGVLAALALSVGLARWLAAPLETLTRAVRRLERGDRQQRIDTSVGGEVGALAEAFNSLVASLARVEQLRQNMVTDIAHELRTPLSSIRGYLEAIQDGVVEPDGQTIATIHRELMLLTRLVDDLQELSLAEAHQLQLHREPVDIRELVDWEVRAFLPEAAANQVALSLEASDDTPEIWVDAGRIRQVLGNIIRNALAHTPAGGSIRATVKADRDRVTVTIEDSGVGIAPDDLEHIFERFYRADKARSRRAGGSGLGLTIARELVRMHGGSLTAESAVGAGTRFIISLPIVTEPPLVRPTPVETAVPERHPARSRLRPLVGQAAMIGALFGAVAGLSESWIAAGMLRRSRGLVDLFGYAILIDGAVFAGLAVLAALVASMVARLFRRVVLPDHVSAVGVPVGIVLVGLLLGYRWNQLMSRDTGVDAPETLYAVAMIVLGSVLVAIVAWFGIAGVVQHWRGTTTALHRRALPLMLIVIFAGAGALVTRDQVAHRLAAPATAATARAPATPRSPASKPTDPTTVTSVAVAAPAQTIDAPRRLPNVLLITVSGLRADHLGAYGYEKARTPTIDSLARAGARFTNALTSQPNRNPAHAAILSGTTPSINGVRRDLVEQLDPSAPSLAHALAVNGRRTAAIYSWVSFEPGYSGLDRGFHDYLDLTINRPEYLADNRAQVLAATYERLKAYLALPGAVNDAFSLAGGVDEAIDGKADVTTEAAIAWLEEHKATPFFLWLHYLDPSYPLSPPPPFDELEDSDCGDTCPDGSMKTVRDIEAGSEYTAAQINHLVGLYDGEIAFTDQQIGRLIERLRQLGLDQDTLIVLTADAGQSFDEHDTWFSDTGVYNAQTRVPLIVVMPGRIPRGTVVTAPATSIDLAPTILDTIGEAVPDAFEGQSLLPLMLGHSAGDDRLAFSELADRSQACVADTYWKLIWTRDGPTVRLYSLIDDPNELTDRSPDHPEVVDRLLAALEEWRATHPN